MKLSALWKETDGRLLQGSDEVEIKGIAYDSRQVQPGYLFVAITGFQTDGHQYVQKALENGAVAVAVEKEVALPKDVAVLFCNNNRKLLAQLGAAFYGHPSRQMTLVGVTGTNGKTSTTYLIKRVLEEKGKTVGLIGTIQNMIGQKELHTGRTTPESLDLQALFGEMKEAGVTDVVMEVSSHALDLHRVDETDFDVAIFTNLTRDHLDYHKTMENYRNAKGILFQMAKKAVVNVDDEAGAYMKDQCKGQVLTFGIDHGADLQAEQIAIDATGVSFQLDYEGKTYPVRLQIPGKFSIYNALGAIGACLFMGIDMETILKGISSIRGVRGRFEPVVSQKGTTAVVDYAHTPDGLENILNTAKEFVKGRIITVFGCGGDRDRTKRPMMGEVAGRLSDYCIITSDNPRSETPEAILLDVEVGTKETGCPYEMICDRKAAIFRAIAMAKVEDLVVVAGKGHEDYQIFADRTIHFDDVEVVKEAFLVVDK